MKYVFIVNPLAGEGKSEETIRSAISVLTEKDNCEMYVTKTIDDATVFVRNWCDTHSDEEKILRKCLYIWQRPVLYWWEQAFHVLFY